MLPQTQWRETFIPWSIWSGLISRRNMFLENSVVSSFLSPLLHYSKVSKDAEAVGWKVPCVFLPFQTPLHPWALDREREGRKERRQVRTRGKMCEKTLRESEGDGTRQIPHRRDTEMMVHCCNLETRLKISDIKNERKPWKQRLRTDRFVKFFSVSLPGDPRPSHSHPSSPALPYNRAKSRSRKCRPLSARCGTAGSGHSGPCSLETLQEIKESDGTHRKQRAM